MTWPELSSRHDIHFLRFGLAERLACAVKEMTVQMTADENVDNRFTGGLHDRGERNRRCIVLS